MASRRPGVRWSPRGTGSSEDVSTRISDTFLRASAVLLLVAAGSTVVLAAQGPGTALERLKSSHARLVRETANGAARQGGSTRDRTQAPLAMVVSCSDLCVSPDAVFGTADGELLVVQTPGGVADRTVAAGLEYGAERLKIPLLVVMGHEACGAVKMAIEAKSGPPGAGSPLEALVAAIGPAFDRMSGPVDVQHLQDAVLAHVEEVVNRILTDSPTLRQLVATGQLQVVGAYYETSTGRVHFSGPVTLTVPKKAAAQPLLQRGRT